ncbi:MAG: hypothetical protein FOGNACKC_01995 [Anaerolineae bacterium]|nr:hypothetical protein [Anaerolineae bacterium]
MLAGIFIFIGIGLGVIFFIEMFIAPLQALDKGDDEPMKIITAQNTRRAMGKNPYRWDK